MIHDFSIVFETDNIYWQRVLEIFAKNEHYDKKVVSGRNLHHKFPRSFSKALGEEVDNDKDNLISLSLADHFLVHYYYYKLAKKGFRNSMATAFRLMARKGLKYMTPETAEKLAADYEAAKTEIIITEETRAKMSVARKGDNNPAKRPEVRAKIGAARKGKKLGPISDEHRARLSAAHKGKKLSDEVRAKMSVAKKGNTNGVGNKGNKGKKLSAETCAKMSAARKGKCKHNLGRHWHLENGKRVYTE